MRHLYIVGELPTVDRQSVVWEEKQCTAVVKKNQYHFKCMLYLEYFHFLTLPTDSLVRWETEVRMSASSPKQPDFISQISHFLSPTTSCSSNAAPIC